MRKCKKRLTHLLVLVMLLTSIVTPVSPASAAGSKVSTKKYTISKKAGTYSKTTKITVAAKKGYKVYYTTGKNLTIKKVIQSGKKKTLTIKKTTTLKLFAVKKNAKMTAKKLKSNTVKKQIKSYKYTIKATSSGSGSDGLDSSASDGSDSPASTSDSIGGSASDTGSTKSTGSSGSSSAGSDGSSTTDGSGSNAAGGSDTSSTGDSGSADGSDTSSTGGSGSADGSDTSSTGDSGSTDQSDEPDVTVTAKEIDAIDYIIDGTAVSDNSAYAVVKDADGLTTVSINSAGTYSFTGSLENYNIVVNKDGKKISDTIALVLDNLTVDNSSLTSDEPVISIGQKTTDVVIAVSGNTTLKGAGSFTKAPAGAVIYASDNGTTLTLQAYENADDAVLTITDSTNPDTDFDGKDPTDGICCKGTLVIVNGTYNITSNGDCLKGTGKKGAGGINIADGTLNLASQLGSALKSKNGVINILGGTINSTYTAEDAINAKKYTVNIKGGTINIDNCYGDGIQGENVAISDGTVDVRTYYEYAGKNFYDTSLDTYNILKVNGDNNKTETVNIDTGSHKGIKAGTKAKTYSYKKILDPDNEDGYVADTEYTAAASGGLKITGGTITIDTTKTGIKYNVSSGSDFGGGGNSATTDTVNGQAVAADGKCIIGAPEDGIHSNNTTVISGGDITIAAADDGISSAVSLVVTGDDTSVKIKTAYEGIESGQICIGKAAETDVATNPIVTVKSNDDGINASSKALTYVYANEEEGDDGQSYTKSSVSQEGNALTVYGGTVTVSINDESSHTITLPYKGQSNTGISYTSNGDGIDCNGSFYAKGGTVIVYGAASNDNGPIDMDNDFEIAGGATVLAIASAGSMTETPTSVGQAYITTSSGTGGGPGSMGGGGIGGMGGGSSSLTLEQGGTLTIYDTDGSTTLLTASLPNKSMGYLLFSAPGMTNGGSYKVTSGSSLITLTGTTNVSSSNGTPGGPGFH